MIDGLIARLGQKKDLAYDDMSMAMSGMLSGRYTSAQSAEFLSKLAEKGETDDELLGMLDKMQEFATKVDISGKDTAVDMCGTGGDGLCTFNVSTAASFVVAAAGGTVAKHGNRSSSGMSGSADVFEYLGYSLEQESEDVARVLERHNITFMFAQKFHPAMRHVAEARRMVGGRTAFNLLGPLANPAGVRNQLVGVHSMEHLGRLARMLERSGAQNALIVRSDDGMDELATSATNRICLLQGGRTVTDTVDPISVGLHKSSLSDIQISSREYAMEAFVRVLRGSANRAMLETCALNAAGGLLVGGIVKDLRDGVELALGAIREGRAFGLLRRFVSDAGDAARLEGIT